MWHWEIWPGKNSFGGWKTWNFAIGGKFSNDNPIWSFRQMPQQKAGGILQRSFYRGEWSKKKLFHINILELLALKFTILTFTKNLSHLTIHAQVDNKVALVYLLKMGGTCNTELLKTSKSIWNYLLSHQITITAKYLPSRLNVRADWKSRNATGSYDWTLHQKVFLKITKVWGTPTADFTNFPNIRHGSQIQTVLQQM